MKNYTILLGFFLLLFACKKEDDLDIVLRVDHKKTTCQAVAETTCYLVQKGSAVGTANWEFFYDEIEGFTFEEGYVQTLKVRVTKVDNPPADASSLKYTLLEVPSKEHIQ